MYLYFMRHGEAEDSIAETGSKEDMDRPLTAKGAEKINEIACGLEHILSEEELPVCIYASSAKRCIQTALVTSTHWERKPKLEVDEVFDDGNDVKEMLTVLHTYGPMPTLIVGHHPAIKEMIGKLIGAKSSIDIHFGLGAVAKIEFEEDKIECGAGSLKFLYNPWIIRKFS